MRNFLIVVLVLAAIGYYFDISPTDFLPSLPNNEPTRERHPAAGVQQAQGGQPQPKATGTPVANNPDGSLATRWSPEPKKP